MLNLLGVGYTLADKKPFEDKPPSYAKLARLFNSDLISFVNSLDPNAWQREKYGVPKWLPYALDKPTNFVYEAENTSFIEPDTWRRDAINLIGWGNRDIMGRWQYTGS